MMMLVMSGLKWWKVVLIIFIIIFVIGAGGHSVLKEVIKGEKPILRLLRKDGVIADRRELKYWDQFLLGHSIHSRAIHNKS